MKSFKRLIAFALLMCMFISLLPPVQFAHAAVIQRYELDTDGIDVGATYLIERYIYFYNHERIQNKTGVAPLTLRHSA